MDNQLKTPKEINDIASELFNQENYEAAAELFLSIAEDDTYGAYAHFMLADISNRTGDPVTSKELYYKSLTIKPDLFKYMLSADNPNYNYVFTGMKDEPPVEACPLCGVAGKPMWCYPTMRMMSFHMQEHNPVRLWMYCEGCHHIYAETFPEQKVMEAGTDLMYGRMFLTRSSRFPHYSAILSKLASYTDGRDLLEIGLGGCEGVLVAQEMGFSVFGVDIMDTGVSLAKKYGIKAELRDFMEFETDEQWSIILFGDVLEHVSDPESALKKLYRLLKDDGVLWLSTPNFDSAFSIVNSHDDGMRLEVSHKNYFSRISLFNLLEKCRFVPVDYQLSESFPGSMEVMIIKDVQN